MGAAASVELKKPADASDVRETNSLSFARDEGERALLSSRVVAAIVVLVVVLVVLLILRLLLLLVSSSY